MRIEAVNRVAFKNLLLAGWLSQHEIGSQVEVEGLVRHGWSKSKGEALDRFPRSKGEAVGTRYIQSSPLLVQGKSKQLVRGSK